MLAIERRRSMLGDDMAYKDKPVHSASIVRAAPVVRMVGEADLGLVREFGERLQPGARVLEVGPFLGGVSVELARHGALHVIDRFLWSEANAGDYPGLLAPGESFRALFEANMRGAGADVAVHEGDYRGGDWPGGPFDLCFIDAPRTAPDLLTCLAALAGRLAPGAVLLVKHGVSPAHAQMTALLGVLLARGIVDLVPTDQPRWCTVAALRAPGGLQQLSSGPAAANLLAEAALSNAPADPWGGASFQLARIAERALAGEPSGAFALLHQLAPGTGRAETWDDFDQALLSRDVDPGLLLVLSELIPVQTDPVTPEADEPLDLSPIRALRGYWRNNHGQPWRPERFDPELIAEAQADGAMALPRMLAGRVRGRHVLEVGAGLGLSGVGFLAAGVASHAGIDMDGLSAGAERAAKRLPALRAATPRTMGSLEAGATDLVVLHRRQGAAAARIAERIAPAAEVIVAERAVTGGEVTWRLRG